MTSPVFKVTLVLLSLVSAVIFGQVLLSATQSSPTGIQAVSAQLPLSQKDSGFELSSVQASQSNEQAFRTGADDSAAQHDKSAAGKTRHSSAPQQQHRRSFSFHYLDILEWMFAGRGDKAKRHQPQRPSAALSGW